MKPVFHFIAILSFLLSVTNVNGQQQITVDLEDYSELHVSGRIDLELVQSDAGEMQISYHNLDPDNITTEFQDGTLLIKIPAKIENNESLDIVLPYRALTKIHAAAGAVINSARDLTAEKLDLSVATGGKIELSVNTTEIKAKVTQVSDIILYGKTVKQDVLVRSGGNYLAYDMECDSTFITVSGAGQGKVSSGNYFIANAKMKGFIGYRGNPGHMELSTSLGGEIITYREDSGE